VIVDTNHANSNKNFRQQPRIAEELIKSINISKSLKGIVKGLMVESYLVEGSQDITGKVFGQSITDSCLGWMDTRKLILRLAQNI